MTSQIERILLIGSGLWYLGEGMLGPLFAIFAQNVGGDVLEISWAWATYLLVLGILTMVVGRYSDKLDKRKIMLLGYSLNALFTFSYLLVSGPMGLFFVQAGLGLALALATPTWDALYMKQQKGKKNEGRAWGIAEGMPDVVIAIAIIIGGFIVNYLSFSTLFIIMGCIQVIATVYQAKILFYSEKKRGR